MIPAATAHIIFRHAGGDIESMQDKRRGEELAVWAEAPFGPAIGDVLELADRDGVGNWRVRTRLWMGPVRVNIWLEPVKP